MRISARPARLAALAVVLCAAIPAGVSSAAKSKNGVRPTAPKNGATIARNTFPTFKARVRGRGVVFFKVCTKKKRDSDGQLCPRGGDDVKDMGRAKKGRKIGRTRVRYHKPKRYTFPSYYLQAPGVYYWQMYRINCTRTKRGRLDCIQESRTQKFTVR